MSIEAPPVQTAPKGVRIIAVVNQKGGVGKTTSVVNIGAGLAQAGRKVLLVDLDAQAHLTYSLGVAADDLEVTVFDLLRGEARLEEALIRTGGLSLVPSSAALTGAEFELSNVPGREGLLRRVFAGVSGYDFIIIDCPPNLGLLTLNALTAANEVFVPLQAEFLAIRGLNSIREVAGKVRERLNAGLRVTGVLVTLFDQRLRLSQGVVEDLRATVGDKLFKTVIRRNVALAESSRSGKSIFEYEPASKGAADYKALCEEILRMGQNNVEEKTA